jgi:predicted RNA-binding protein (virulence factor B family)
MIRAQVTDENTTYYFAQIDGITYQIDKSELEKPLKIGGYISGFAYENEQHQRQITKAIPSAQQDQFGWGEVVSSRHDLGVFVNIGLPNKDIVISLDDLPTLKGLWPQKGDRVMMALTVDHKERLWGELADSAIFEAIARRAPHNLQNKTVKATAYRLKMAGTLVITDEHYLGFIHPSQFDEEPRLGQVLDARVVGVRTDGILNLSLKPRAHEAMDDDAQFLLLQLQRRENKALPFNDKSDANAIKKQFGMSKSQFKRAIGRLLKQRLITQDTQGIHLVDAD